MLIALTTLHSHTYFATCFSPQGAFPGMAPCWLKGVSNNCIMCVFWVFVFVILLNVPI